MADGKKNPNQTRNHISLYHNDSTIATIWTKAPSALEEKPLQKEGHGEAQRGRRAALVPASRLASLGRYPPAHPSPGAATCGAPRGSCQTGTETAELFSQPRTYLFVHTLLCACNTHSCSLSHREMGDYSTK